MKRLFALLLVLAVSALSCGQASPKIDATSDLESMLSKVPAELASTNVLWFSNMERVKELAGVEPDTDMTEFVSATTKIDEYRRRMDLMAGYFLSDFSGGKYTEYWPDVFGFNMFNVRQEIVVESLLQPHAARPLFSIMKGNFDKDNIAEKLKGLGYQILSYSSNDYFSINADYMMGGPISNENLLMAKSFLNRMLVENQEIIAAPADDIFFPVLDARSGKQNSLSDSLAYTRIAGSLENVLGAALIRQSQLRSENIKADWGNLDIYDLAGIGYQVEGQERKLVILLHYADKSAANDIDEIKNRLTQYDITTMSFDNPSLSSLFDIGEPEAINYDSDSILKVELVYRPETPSTLWSELVESQDLGFLVPDSSN
jgi:hypothetical protein